MINNKILSLLLLLTALFSCKKEKQLVVKTTSTTETTTTTANVIGGQGTVTSQNIPVSGFFYGIELNITASIVYVQDPVYSITITAQPNITKIIDINIENTILKINTTGSFSTINPVQIEIHSPDIRSMVINGAGKIVSNTKIDASDVTLLVNGTGSIVLEKLTTANLRATVTGGTGLIKITDGFVVTETLLVNSNGSIDCVGLQSTNCDVSAENSSTISLWVNTYFKATISGSSVVYYKGNPITVNFNISGNGQLIHI